jgi:hypothetical protein
MKHPITLKNSNFFRIEQPEAQKNQNLFYMKQLEHIGKIRSVSYETAQTLGNFLSILCETTSGP